MAGNGFDSPADIVQTLGDLAKAVLDRRGEAATTDLTRVALAPQRSHGDGKAREGKK